MNDAQTIIDFMRYAEGLKTELRRGHTSAGRRESVAEHSWSLCLMLMLVASKLSVKVDLLRALKIAIVHDLVEIDANDTSILHYLTNEEAKAAIAEREERAMEHIRELIGGATGDEVRDLWLELEALETPEARVVKALDRIEGQSQFLYEKVTIFPDEEMPVVEKLFESTAGLAAVDPLIAEVYAAVLGPLRERVAMKEFA